MKTSKAILLGVILLPLGLFLHGTYAYLTLGKAAKEAHEKQQQEFLAKKRDENLAKIKQGLDLLSKSSQVLPKPNQAHQLQNKTCPSQVKTANSSYHMIDAHYMTQFKEGKFVFAPLKEMVWYRSKKLSLLQENLLKAENEWDHEAMAKAFDEVIKPGYLYVIYSQYRTWPKLTDKKTFVSGEFKGAGVLLDLNQQKSVCQFNFEAASSKKIDTVGLKVAKVITVVDNKESAIEDDFKDNFWKAFYAAAKSVESSKN